ncbi:hypothetical protein LguiA_017942 [Lonicera macranthoides]
MAGGSKLHVVMFPWLAFGHIIPFLELSKFIAQKGHKVSFVSTTRNIDRLPKIPQHLSPLITLVKLNLPVDDHIPAGAEATMDVKTADIQYLKKAVDGLESQLTKFLEHSSPDWIIYDFFPHWLPPVARKLGISRAYFSVITSWFIAFWGPSSEAIIDSSDPRKEPEDYTVPPEWVKFPTRVAFRTYEVNSIIGAVKENDSGLSDVKRARLVISGSDVIFVRQCVEFEPEWLKLLEELHHKPVIPVGLMPPTAHNSGDDSHVISEWLNSQSKQSVVYIALGSEVMMSQHELTELALGLELSNLPFFWAFRKPAGSSESDTIELPAGFEKRVEGRGIVWTSWAPQLMILSHDSVGGFLTHCGWSSCIEGLVFGQPLIMLSFLVDQGLNARVLAEKKVGIEVPRNEDDGSFTRDSVAKSLRSVMVEDEGTNYREKAMEMSRMFGDKNLHDEYLEKFIKYLENNRNKASKKVESI